MPEQIYIGNFPKGQINAREAFVIDNDSFPYLYNFYVWRGKAKRKRGTYLLGRLQIQVQSVLTAAPPNNYQVGQIMVLDGSGNGSANLISLFSLPTGSSIVPGSIHLTDGTNTFTEPATPNGTLVGVPSGTGTINYSTGALTITGGAPAGIVRGIAVSGANTQSFSYYPSIPVMGLRDFVANGSNSLYPFLLAFDMVHSYQVNQSSTPFFYNTTFYKQTNTPFVWSGLDYQLFWTVNYSSALWATNGKPGFHFVNGTYTSGTGTALITFNFKSGGVNYTQLLDGDKIWFNEWDTGGSTINGLVGTVTTNTDAANGNYVVTFTGNQTVAGTGIGELLTASIAGQDGIKWYDGDPTGGTGLPTGTNLGWSNFAPPLTASVVSINNIPAKKYYLVGAQLIQNFKDRQLFLNPYVQASTDTSPTQLQDTVIFSWNGTPYYANVPTTTANVALETADPRAYYVDQTGLGGYQSAGISQPITTVAPNEDVLIVGFGGARGRKTRFVYTGNDFQPFLFFNINSELPSDSTFSAIALDRGSVDLGPYGIALTDQQSSTRIDLEIPDAIFDIQEQNNGIKRVNALRDFLNEWIYFSYPVDSSDWRFPTQTFLYNYRDQTWAILYENYTAHGNFRTETGYTWDTLPYATWDEWTETWESGSATALFALTIAGNPQGYVLVIGEGTGEGASGGIQSITGNTITSIDHCVAVDDYLYFSAALGLTGLNGTIRRVIATPTANTFTFDGATPTGTYLGLGTFTRLSQPLMQTKQFNPYWNEGRQVRLSAQKYLLDATGDGQITVNIYLSQDSSTPWNDPNEVVNSSLEYSQLLYTCQESTNLGLTPANTNLQMPTAATQAQIWHRMNTSLLGDSVQIGFTLSDTQMRDLNLATSEIVLHGMHLIVSKSSMLA